jgi:hypothetical protein
MSRRTLALFAALFLAVVAVGSAGRVATASSPSGPVAAPLAQAVPDFPADWTHKEQFTGTVATDKSAIAQWQFKLDLAQSADTTTLFGAMESDGADIRVTRDEAGTVELSFWIQELDTGAATGVLWVKETLSTQLDAGAVAFWVWVGGGAVATASDIDALLIGEDFRDANHATVIANLAGDISEADGVMLANHDGFANGEIAIDGGTGWRQVSVREQSNIVKVGATFTILVSGQDSSGNVDVGLYTATDIEGTWTEFGSNPVISLAEDPYIVVEEDGTPYNDGTYYYVFFERKAAADATQQLGIGVARTTDFQTYEEWNGTDWTGGHSSILARGGGSAWDEGTATNFIGSPTAFMSGTTVYVLYEGWDSGLTNEATGLATLSTANLTADPDQIAKSFTDGGPFTTGPEVPDDIRKIGTDYWLIGHDEAGSMRRYTTSTAVASWAVGSFTQDGWDPFEAGGHSVNLVFDGTTDFDHYATWQRTIGTTGINLVLLVGGTKWRPVNLPNEKSYTAGDNEERDREIIVDETNGHLTAQPVATMTGSGASRTAMSFGLMTQTALLPAVDFEIRARRRTQDNGGADRNAFTHIAFGTGEPDVDVTNNAEMYGYIHTGVLYSVFAPGSNGVQLREYSAAEASVGTVADDQASPITDAVVEAFNEHILRYVADGGNGTVSVDVGGTEYASGSPANDLTTGAKHLFFGQGQRGEDDGGISDWQWVFARNYDGDDPAFAGQGVEETAATAALTGTVTNEIEEADIVTGGETIILTLTNDTWDATAGADNAVTDALIAGITAASSPANGWNNEVTPALDFNDVTRTSDTIVTVVLPAVAGYDITALETITAVIPASALTTSGDPLTATPSFTVDTVPSVNANLSALTLSDGTLTPSFAQGTTDYTASVANAVTSTDVTATTADGNATLTIEGQAATSGVAETVALAVGENVINIIVTAEDTVTTKEYIVTVTRAAPAPTPTPTPTPGGGASPGDAANSLVTLIPLIFVVAGIGIASVFGFIAARNRGSDLVTGVVTAGVVLIVFLLAVPLVVSLTQAVVGD